jgi:hypothetical protein
LVGYSVPCLGIFAILTSITRLSAIDHIFRTFFQNLREKGRSMEIQITNVELEVARLLIEASNAEMNHESFFLNCFLRSRYSAPKSMAPLVVQYLVKAKALTG